MEKERQEKVSIPKVEQADHSPDFQFESKPESTAEQPKTDHELAVDIHESRQAPAVQPAEHIPQKSVVLQAVEDILAEDLLDAYLSMDTESQQKFKIKGEEVAVAIVQMYESGRMKVKKILDLIREWLGMIPGVNHFFLEQESKIKTDKILNYYQSHR